MTDPEPAHPAFSRRTCSTPPTTRCSTPTASARPHYDALYDRLRGLPADELRHRQQAADLSFLHQGITFTVYGDERGHRAHLPLRPAAAHHHRGASGRRSSAA